MHYQQLQSQTAVRGPCGILTPVIHALSLVSPLSPLTKTSLGIKPLKHLSSFHSVSVCFVKNLVSVVIL